MNRIIPGIHRYWWDARHDATIRSFATGCAWITAVTGGWIVSVGETIEDAPEEGFVAEFIEGKEQ